VKGCGVRKGVGRVGRGGDDSSSIYRGGYMIIK